MRIALAQLNFHIGNISSNVSSIKKAIAVARNEHAELIVFSELAICGYSPMDLLEFKEFLENCHQAINELAAESKDIGIIIGAPAINPLIEGKNLFNAAYLLADGAIRSVHYKGLIPNYDIFDEYRYFEPSREFKVASFGGYKLAITVCEDMWDVMPDKMYTLSPMDELIKQEPDVIININGSPFDANRSEERKEVLRVNVGKYGLPLVYVNQVGAQTNVIFDGASMVWDAEGNLVSQLSSFAEEVKIVDVHIPGFAKRKKNPAQMFHPKPVSSDVRISSMHDALVCGIRDYFAKMGFKKAILGLSGGVDSALVAVLASKALGADNVKCILLPSEFSTVHSISDAEQLAQNLGCSHETISIQPAFESLQSSLATQFKHLPFNLTEENLQARTRGVLLMALSNKFGYILLNTSNKSEMAVGYGTLYGDMCGGLAVIGDVYKTEVYELCNFINREKEIIPSHILTKAPSAELRHEQKDSDSLPPYDVLDKILFHYIENRKGPQEIKDMGFSAELVQRIIRLVDLNEYKRYQSAPALRVSNKAFGSGRRMPIVAKPW